LARKPADQSVSREEIIVAAADVLQRHGYEATTMKDIAAAVNLTAASLYHHFRNKDALLLAVLEAGLEHVLSEIESIIHSTSTTEDKLRRMIHTHVVGLTQNTAVGAAMVFEIQSLMGAKEPPAHAQAADHAAYQDFVERRKEFFARRDQFEDSFRQVIGEGIEKQVFRPVDVGIFTKTLLGAQNWVGVWYKPEGRLTGQQIADMMADIFLRALKP
jgi:TetR/AcrR family transcriptional regulator, cholesterol catabolism regulator